MPTRTVPAVETAPSLPATTAGRLTMAGPSRTDRFRFDVLSPRLQVVGQLHPIRPGISISNNINRDIKRTMEGFAIPAVEAISVNYFMNRLRPVWVLADGTEYPLGVFVISDASTVRHSWGRSAELTLADQGLILAQLLDRSVGWGPGQSVRDALAWVCTVVGLPAFEIDATEARFGAPVAWALGNDTWARVLNDLSALAGFTSGYFDNEGTFQLRRTPSVAAGAQPDFDYDNPDRVFADSIVESDATIESANRFIVISTSGTTGAPVVGTWDVPASAPHSYENRGFRVVKVAERQGLSMAQADEAARALGMQEADSYAWASFGAVPDPRHDTFDVVRWNGQLWREQGWTLDLAPGGEHRHELRRAYVPGADQ